jgi:hypothetical protein
MKKRLVALLAGLLTVLSMGFGLAQFSDVPAGHWAKEAVEALAAKGIIVGFPDGTYRGNENLTRYQAALIIYRLLQQIEEELKAKGTSPTMEAMSPEDLEALKNAIQELAAELAALGVRVSALEDSAATKDDIARLEAMLQELKAQPAPEPGMDQAALQDLMDRVEAASIAADTALAQAQQLAAELAALGVRVSALEDSAATKDDIARLEAMLQELKAQLAPEPGMDQAALQDLMDRVEAASIAADTALAQAQQLAERLEALAQDVEGVKDELAALSTQVEANAQAIQALNELAVILNQDVLALRDQVAALEKGAVTQEDLANLKASLEELKGRLESVEALVESLASDLTDRVEAASIAADTALAQAQQLAEQLEALAQAVEGVKGDLAALSTQVEANAQAIQTLNELAVLLNQDVLSLQDRVTALEKGLADLQGIDFEQFATKEDVAAVQEFAAALRSDLVSLSEKVSKLEGQVADLSKVQYSIKGSLTATYGFVTLAGDNFDIDRLFATPFSTGVFGRSTLPPDRQVGSNVELPDVASRQLTEGSLTLDFGVKNNAPAATEVAVSEATVQIAADAIALEALTPNLRLNTATLKGTVDGQPFSVVYHWRASSFQFNDYLFVNKSDPARRERRQGVVATFQGTKLPLSPEVTVVLGTSLDGDPGDVFGDNGYFGIRAAFKPLEGLTLALNYALADTEPLTATPPDNPDRTALGVDGTLELGDFSVKGLFVTSRPETGIYFRNYFDPKESDWVYYIQLDGKLGPLSLKANYHAVDPQYENGEAGMSADHLEYYGGVKGKQNPAPYKANEEGLGVELGLPLGPAELGGYLNSYGAYPYKSGPITTKAGASAKVALFSGFSLKAAYDAAWTGASYVDLAAQTSASITGTLSHDGAAKDALVKDLNLTLEGTYNNLHTSSPYFGLAVYGDYKFALGPLSLDKILFRYHEPNFNTQGGETLKGGLQASVKLDTLPLKPSLTGEVAARRTEGSAVTEELKWSVGLSLGEFLFPGSKLEARYGEYRASKVDSILVGATNSAFDPSDDRLYSDSGTVSGSVAGFNVTWSYYDFRADYGEYITSLGGHARTFRVTYTVKF